MIKTIIVWLYEHIGRHIPRRERADPREGLPARRYFPRASRFGRLTVVRRDAEALVKKKLAAMGYSRRQIKNHILKVRRKLKAEDEARYRGAPGK